LGGVRAREVRLHTIEAVDVSQSFFSSLLRGAVIPKTVGPGIVAAFGARYGYEMVHNPSLGAAVVALGESDEEEILLGLATVGDIGVLHLLLRKQELSDKILKRLLESWILSPPDQLRLVEHLIQTATETTVQTALEKEWFSQAAKGRLAAAFPTVGWARRSGVAQLRISQPSKNRKRWERMTERPFVGDSFWDEYSPATTDRRGDPYVSSIGGYLTKRLGRGSNDLSRRAWVIFLSLAEEGPDRTLLSMTEAAVLLARAEAASA
jgi:hypothetical protein